MVFACECVGKCNGTIGWPEAAVLIALCTAAAIAIWAMFK